MVRGALAMSTHHLMAGDLWPRGNASSGIQSDKPEPVTSEFSYSRRGDLRSSTQFPRWRYIYWHSPVVERVLGGLDHAKRSMRLPLWIRRCLAICHTREEVLKLATERFPALDPRETTSPVRYWT